VFTSEFACSSLKELAALLITVLTSKSKSLLKKTFLFYIKICLDKDVKKVLAIDYS
jgi:hypothetical protein